MEVSGRTYEFTYGRDAWTFCYLHAPIAARVFGPTIPVVWMACSRCHCLRAASVIGPKEPVMYLEVKSLYCVVRNFCSAATSAPFMPRERVRDMTGHLPL